MIHGHLLVFNWRPKSDANRGRRKTSHRLDLSYNIIHEC